MSIDKESEGKRGRYVTIPLSAAVLAFLRSLFMGLVVATPIIGLLAIVWAVELGVVIRVCKEAYEWGYSLIF